MNNQYQHIKAVSVNGKLVPIWDAEYRNIDNGEYEVEEFYVNGIQCDSHEPIECLFNLKTKQIEHLPTIVLQIRPKFKIGDEVLISTHPGTVRRVMISEIALGRIKSEFISSRQNPIDGYLTHPNYDVISLPTHIMSKTHIVTHFTKYMFSDGSFTERDHEIFVEVK